VLSACPAVARKQDSRRTERPRIKRFVMIP
jgi:hypothetical protein